MIRQNAQHPAVAVAACATELAPGAPIQLLPLGTFRARDGRPAGLQGWRLDELAARRLIDKLAARADAVVIDYEHQTLNAADNGQPAPAAGWFRGEAVELRDGGLWVAPEWTAAAKAHIEAGEYKYFSPVIVYDRRSGAVLDLQMGALTNYAAIDGMREIEARAAAKYLHTSPPDNGDRPMDEIIKALGLAADATDDQALAALTALQAEKTTLEQSIEDLQTAVAAAKAQTPDSAVEAMRGLQNELAALKAGLQDREVDELIAAALAAGTLVPAQEQWARDLGQSDLAALKGYLDTAQPIAALAGQQSRGKTPPDQDAPLSEIDQAVCKAMGLDEADYRATLAG